MEEHHDSSLLPPEATEAFIRAVGRAVQELRFQYHLHGASEMTILYTLKDEYGVARMSGHFIC